MAYYRAKRFVVGIINFFYAFVVSFFDSSTDSYIIARRSGSRRGNNNPGTFNRSRAVREGKQRAARKAGRNPNEFRKKGTFTIDDFHVDEPKSGCSGCACSQTVSTCG
ncbi:hypothetical protein PCE1_002601 [Barthelona sp. PCE]